MDEFEREFQKLREDVRNVKEKLNQRQELIKHMTEKSAQSISKSTKNPNNILVLRNSIEKMLGDCFE